MKKIVLIVATCVFSVMIAQPKKPRSSQSRREKRQQKHTPLSEAKRKKNIKPRRLPRNKNHSLRETPLDHTTSIIVPCYYGHAKHLYSLLRILENQTVLSDQVVISLSEYKKVPTEIYDALEQELWSFRVLIVLSEDKLYAGPNRNRACAHAAGDIFICQDADDIPYPTRIETIKYFFDNYEVNHLMHCWTPAGQDDEIIFGELQDPSNVKFRYPKDLNGVFRWGQFTNGNVAIDRSVMRKIRWSGHKRGQDTIFNRKAYKEIQDLIAIKVPLLVYRQFLSSIGNAQTQYVYELPEDVIPGFVTNHPELKQHKVRMIEAHE